MHDRTGQGWLREENEQNNDKDEARARAVRTEYRVTAEQGPW
jgi:hypothetical protein